MKWNEILIIKIYFEELFLKTLRLLYFVRSLEPFEP